MRDSRWPRGTCTAPGIWPSSHSSRSRTSTMEGGLPLVRRRARVGSVDLVDLALDLRQQLSVRRQVALTSIATPGRPDGAAFAGRAPSTPPLRSRPSLSARPGSLCSPLAASRAVDRGRRVAMGARAAVRGRPDSRRRRRGRRHDRGARRRGGARPSCARAGRDRPRRPAGRAGSGAAERLYEPGRSRRRTQRIERLLERAPPEVGRSARSARRSVAGPTGRPCARSQTLAAEHPGSAVVHLQPRARALLAGGDRGRAGRVAGGAAGRARHARRSAAEDLLQPRHAARPAARSIARLRDRRRRQAIEAAARGAAPPRGDERGRRRSSFSGRRSSSAGHRSRPEQRFRARARARPGKPRRAGRRRRRALRQGRRRRKAFSRLGPLPPTIPTRRSSGSISALLLLWLRDVDGAREQLQAPRRRARAASTEAGRAAPRLVCRHRVGLATQQIVHMAHDARWAVHLASCAAHARKRSTQGVCQPCGTTVE